MDASERACMAAKQAGYDSHELSPYRDIVVDEHARLINHCCRHDVTEVNP